MKRRQKDDDFSPCKFLAMFGWNSESFPKLSCLCHVFCYHTGLCFHLVHSIGEPIAPNLTHGDTSRWPPQLHMINRKESLKTHPGSPIASLLLVATASNRIARLANLSKPQLVWRNLRSTPRRPFQLSSKNALQLTI